MARRVLLSIFVCLSFLSVYATHERAGEITYRHISGLTYEFTITTYTYSPSPADRPQLSIDWGDGTGEIVQRKIKDYLGNDIQHNTYVATHTYVAVGTYIISMEDPNRNGGIINIPNSVDKPFYIQSTLIINPFLSPNNSPTLTNPPIDNGCVGIPFYHNPGAVDLDGDSLVYSLIDCRGYAGENIPGYILPHTSYSISIDRITGDFYWDSPMLQGEYNIAILIEEYRMGVKVGDVVRDMQITITTCDTNHRPPLITAINDTCVNAGDYIAFQVNAQSRDTVILEAYGDVFRAAGGSAVFQKTIAIGTATSPFYWQTRCLHVRKQPYQVTFKATNRYKTSNLTSLKTVRITVVSPAPQNLQAVPFQNTISLSWDPTPCSGNAVGYKIYRRINSSGFVPAHCQTGVPDYTGYKQIGTTDIHTRTFTDNNNGSGLLRGTRYCYLVIAYFIDGAESYASNEACAFLKKDVPIITNVSILETDNSMGIIEVKWVKPTEFDSVQYPGPYYYTINRSTNNASNFTTIAASYSFDSTRFIDNLQNTHDNTFFYRIDFFNKTTTPFLIGSSDIASSIFLTINSTDRKLILSWNELVPWNNENYTIYRKNNGIFDSIGQTNVNTFTDVNLENNQTYCYYIKSQGRYTDATLPYPLINLSQIACETPIDNVPPCPPILQGTTDCKDISIEWSFATDCDLDDVYMLYLYYRNGLSADYLMLDSILPPRVNYQITNLPSIVGCFFLVAKDSVGNKSKYSNELCFDTDICDSYRLPNVFTPNGDGINDLFRPFPYDYVESIDMHIYNRWGELVFKTKNADVLWDGTNQFTKRPCVAGVYFYVCDVNEYTLNGIRTRHLNGSVTLLR